MIVTNVTLLGNKKLGISIVGGKILTLIFAEYAPSYVETVIVS